MAAKTAQATKTSGTGARAEEVKADGQVKCFSGCKDRPPCRKGFADPQTHLGLDATRSALGLAFLLLGLESLAHVSLHTR